MSPVRSVQRRAVVVLVASVMIALAAVSLGVRAIPGAQAASPGPVHPVVDGNRLVDARTGNTWVPHGVNWPDLEYACVQGWVPSHPTIETQRMAAWSVDVVRLPLNQGCWLGLDGAPTTSGGTTAYRALVKARVDAIHAAGMVAILDLHWTSPAGTLANGQRSMADSQSATFWSSVATAYRDDPAVMFELFNEPYSRGTSTGLSWACWRNGGCNVPTANDTQAVGGSTYTVTGMAALVAAVRAAGAHQPLLLGGLNYSNDLTGWLANRPADDQLVAAWHNYPGQGCWTPCWNTTITTVATQVPVLMTEFGYVASDPTAFVQTMQWADAHGIGYLPWTWWRTGSGDSPASQLYALVEGNDFTPKQPAGVLYHDHLAGLVPPPTTTSTTTATPTTTSTTPATSPPSLPPPTSSPPPPTVTPPPGVGSAGAMDSVPVVPDRVLDTRASSQVGYAGATPTSGQTIEVDVTRTGAAQVPDDATAVVLNVTGTDAAVAGYVTVWPCGSPQPTASNLNLRPGVATPNLVVAKIGTAGRVCLFTQTGANLVVDINGYMPSGSRYTALVPERLLDTRPVGQTGYAGAAPTAGSTITLHVTGAGSSAVPADATAAILNITGIDAKSAGYVTVWPCGTAQPRASNLNLAAGSTAANLVVSKIGQNGNVCIFVQSAMDLVADINGYLPAGSSFEPLVPERILDSRVDGQTGYRGGKPEPGSTVTLQVTGVGTSPVPATATAVVLNITGVEPDAAGYVTVWPCGSPRPSASNLNLVPGDITPNLVMAKIGVDGTVCIFTQSSAHVVADISGYWR